MFSSSVITWGPLSSFRSIGTAVAKLNVGGENQLLVTVTEKRTAAEIDTLVNLLKEVA